MTEHAATDTALAADEAGVEPLAWENLGSVPAGRAFAASLVLLLARPSRFFRCMAVSGGLHEPLTFFTLILGTAVLLAFPAALLNWLLAPTGAALAETWARATGLLLAMLPLVLGIGVLAMVLTGSLFHAAGKPFGTGRWEGSVSVWFYAGGAALVPLVASTAVLLVACLVGYLLSLLWPDVGGPLHSAAGWAALGLLPAGVLAGAVILVIDAVAGTTHAHRLAPEQGAAAGLAGLLLVGVVIAGVVLAFRNKGPGVGLAAAGIAACMAAAIAGAGIIGARHAEEVD